MVEKDQLAQKLQIVEKESERMQVWGDFSHSQLDELRNNDLILRFFSCNLRKFDQEWEVLYNAFEIDTVGSTRYFLTITKPGVVVEIDADPIKLSDKTVVELDGEILEIRSEIELLKSELIQLSVNDYNSLKAYQALVMGDIDFSKVLLNTNAEAAEKVIS